jgi:hypothetical protein
MFGAVVNLEVRLVGAHHAAVLLAQGWEGWRRVDRLTHAPQAQGDAFHLGLAQQA